MKIIRITAMWCMSCLAMKRVWRKTIENIEGIEIIDYDYDQDREAVDKLNVGKILPEVIIYKNDEEVIRIIGEKKIKQMNSIIEELNEAD